MSRTVTTVRETTWDTSSAATFTDTFTLSNLGALTTTFTPPSACLTTWYITSFHLELGVQSQPACFPHGFTPGNAQTSYYFSPGLCPSSYTGATSLGLWWTTAGESGVHCCPLGYWLPAAVTASCFTPLSSSVTTSYTDGSILRVGVFSEIWAPAIPVVWKSLAEFSTTANSGSAGITPAPSHAVSLPPSSTTNTVVSQTIFVGGTTASTPNHVRTIALATAIPIVLILLAIVAFILLRRRRRGRPAAPAPPDTSLPELPGNADDVHKPGVYWPAPVEMPAIPAAVEMSAVAAPVEMPTTRVELPSTATRPPPDMIATLQDDAELDWLNRELRRVNERREKLREMQALDDERVVLQRRIDECVGGGAV